jgi:hypothetical protein
MLLDRVIDRTMVRASGWSAYAILVLIIARAVALLIFAFTIGSEEFLLLPECVIFATLITVKLALDIIRGSRKATVLLILYLAVEAVIAAFGPWLLPLLIGIVVVRELPPKDYFTGLVLPYTLRWYLLAQMLLIASLVWMKFTKRIGGETRRW